MAARNEFDQTIQETEAAYYKVGETVHVLALSWTTFGITLADFGEQSDTATGPQARECQPCETQAILSIAFNTLPCPPIRPL